MPLLYGPDGELWPAGSLIRTISTDADTAFETGTLPAWLTLASGTSGSSSTDPGGVSLLTAASVNATAGLQGAQITLSKFRRVRLDACFTLGSDDGVQFELGFQGTASGGWFSHSDPDSDGVLNGRASGPTTTPVDVLYSVADTSANKRFSVFVIVDPSDGTVAVGEHDQVFAHYVFGAALGTSTARPFIRWTSLDGAAWTGHVHQIILTREWL